MTAAEYLAWERVQPTRHEYVQGEVFDMSGGTPRHAALIAAVTIELGLAHRGGRCRVLASDQRIVAADAEHYVYADASVVCGAIELAPGTSDVLVNPTVVVEVLSKSTEAYDRGKKWGGYQKIPSVTDCLLVSQSTPQIEHYQRAGGGEWHYRLVGPGGRVTLASNAVLELDAIYRGVFEIEGE
jgi:Uma2 family endonuclease